MTKTFYVYAKLRETGEPFYIGKGTGRRWSMHEREARRGERAPRHIVIRDIWARGFEPITIIIHEGLTEATAHQYEIALIAALGRTPHGPLVNLTDGGDGLTGYVASEETRKRLSKVGLGRKHRPETKAAIAAKHMGRKMPPEAVEASAAKHRGKKRSPELCARQAAALAATHARKRELDPTYNPTAAARRPEAILKNADARRGKPRSPSAVEATAAKHKGKKRSDEARANMKAGWARRNEMLRSAKPDQQLSLL